MIGTLGSLQSPGIATTSGYGAADEDKLGALQSAATSQASLAQRGYPLSSIHAEGHPSIVSEVPGNDIGARLRAAYWLAVGARVAQHRGQDPFASNLLSRARSEVTKANTLALPGMGLFGIGRGKGEVQAILNDAAVFATQNGVPSVTNKLMSLGSDYKAIAKAHKKSEKAGGRKWLTDQFGSAQKAFWKRMKWPLIIVGTMAVLGLGFWAYTATR